MSDSVLKRLSMADYSKPGINAFVRSTMMTLIVVELSCVINGHGCSVINGLRMYGQKDT